MASGDNSLPDLVAKVKLDDTAAIVAAENVGKKIDRVYASSSRVSPFARFRGQADDAGKSVEGMSERIGKLAEVSTRSGAAIRQGIFEPFIMAGGSIPIIGGVVAGVAGLFAALDHLASETSTYSAGVLRNSQLLGMNTTTFQALALAADKFGISQQSLTQTLERFQRNLMNGLPALRGMGLSMADIGITSTDTGTAIDQLSTYLHNNTNAAQRNAVAIAALGRQGALLLPVLAQGPDFLKHYTAELEHWGIILDENELKTSAATKVIDDQFHMALQGLERQVGVNLEAAFSRLYLSIMHALGPDPKAAFDKIGSAIANVLEWVVGLIDGLFGLQITLADFTGATSSANAALDGMANTTQDAGDQFAGTVPQIRSAANSTRALEEATRAQTDALDAQIKALDNQYSALENQFKMEDLLQQQADATHQSYLAQLQDRLNAATAVDDSRRHSGEGVLDYERRMQRSSIESAIRQEQDRRTLVKTTHDLRLQQFKEETDARKQSLEDQKAALERYLQSAQQAQQDAASAINSIADSVASNAIQDFHLTNDQQQAMFDDVNKKASQMGVSMGIGINQAIGKIGDLINALVGVVSALNDIENKAHEAFQAVQVGYDNVKLDVQKYGINPISSAWNTATSTLGGLTSLLGFADGGDPPVNRPYWVGENGPELKFDRTPSTIVPADRVAAAVGGVAGGRTYVANFYGPVADEMVASRIQRRWDREQERRGRALGAGIA